MSTQLSAFRHTALLVATGLLAASLSLPAFAAAPDPAVPMTSAPAAAGSGTSSAGLAGGDMASTNHRAGAPAAKAKKYCVMTQQVTGSIVSGRVCKTKAGWAAEGVDIEAATTAG